MRNKYFVSMNALITKKQTILYFILKKKKDNLVESDFGHL